LDLKDKTLFHTLLNDNISSDYAKNMFWNVFSLSYLNSKISHSQEAIDWMLKKANPDIINFHDLQNRAHPTILSKLVRLDRGDIQILKQKVKILLNQGADPNIQGNNGQTALHFAAMREDTEIFELLLANGADPNIRDNNGKTAHDILIEKGLAPTAGQIEPNPEYYYEDREINELIKHQAFQPETSKTQWLTMSDKTMLPVTVPLPLQGLEIGGKLLIPYNSMNHTNGVVLEKLDENKVKVTWLDSYQEYYLERRQPEFLLALRNAGIEVDGEIQNKQVAQQPSNNPHDRASCGPRTMDNLHQIALGNEPNMYQDHIALRRRDMELIASDNFNQYQAFPSEAMIQAQNDISQNEKNNQIIARKNIGSRFDDDIKRKNEDSAKLEPVAMDAEQAAGYILDDNSNFFKGALNALTPEERKKVYYKIINDYQFSIEDIEEKLKDDALAQDFQAYLKDNAAIPQQVDEHVENSAQSAKVQKAISLSLENIPQYNSFIQQELSSEEMMELRKAFLDMEYPNNHEAIKAIERAESEAALKVVLENEKKANMQKTVRALRIVAEGNSPALQNAKEYLTTAILEMPEDKDKQEFMTMVYNTILVVPNKATEIVNLFPEGEEKNILKDFAQGVVQHAQELQTKAERAANAANAVHALRIVAEGNSPALQNAKKYLTAAIPKMPKGKDKEEFMNMVYNTILDAPNKATEIVNLFPEGKEKTILKDFAQGVVVTSKINEALKDPSFKGRKNLENHLKELGNGQPDNIKEDSLAAIGKKIFGRVTDADLIRKMFQNLNDKQAVLHDIDTKGYRIKIRNSDPKVR
jgi:hypothetical protein